MERKDADRKVWTGRTFVLLKKNNHDNWDSLKIEVRGLIPGTYGDRREFDFSKGFLADKDLDSIVKYIKEDKDNTRMLKSIEDFTDKEEEILDWKVYESIFKGRGIEYDVNTNWSTDEWDMSYGSTEISVTLNGKKLDGSVSREDSNYEIDAMTGFKISQLYCKLKNQEEERRERPNDRKHPSISNLQDIEKIRRNTAKLFVEDENKEKDITQVRDVHLR